MGAERIQLPFVYRFNPFEHELIGLFLKPKILGQQLICNVVEEKEVYGPDANPWKIFDSENYPWILSEASPGKFEKITYVFVNCTKKAVVKKNKSKREQFIKKAGCGTWDGKTKTEIRDFNGDLIGDRRMLVFQINEVLGMDDISKLGHWRMHEYSLCGINKDIFNPNNTVLCKITLDSSKPPIINLHPNKTINLKQPPATAQRTNGQKLLENYAQDASSSITTNPLITDQELGFSQNSEEADWEEWFNGILVSGEGEDEGLYLNITDFDCPSDPEQLVDINTNPGKRKLVETSSANKRLCC